MRCTLGHDLFFTNALAAHCALSCDDGQQRDRCSARYTNGVVVHHVRGLHCLLGRLPEGILDVGLKLQRLEWLRRLRWLWQLRTPTHAPRGRR